MATKAELEIENEKLKDILRRAELSTSQKIEAGLLPEVPDGSVEVSVLITLCVPIRTFRGWYEEDYDNWICDPTDKEQDDLIDAVIHSLSDSFDIPGASVASVEFGEVW